MAKNLLIVESPTKVKTLKKYLPRDFEVMASVGHVKDLPVNKLGVDIEAGFRPEYVVIKGKGKVLKALKDAAKKAQVIFLGPDPDREGEAIAWHIAEELNGGKKRVYRVLFNELTPRAIREAVASPQDLNREKFESQQARRILDRLVGYQISPLLWTKVKRGLSAGRVQSVALKMICDREREIFNFVPEEYWSLTAHLEADQPPIFKARLSRWKEQKASLKNEEQVREILKALEGERFRVLKIVKKKKKKNAPPPFITSQLQQEAYKRLGFSAKKTMSIAQNLYEGVELGAQGQVGLITYMRTDSFRMADEAISAVRDYIKTAYGSEFVPEKPNRFRSPKGAQEAHEAIRPTSVQLTPDEVAPFLNKDQLSLYSLIWRRFVACQMAPAEYHQTQVDIQAGEAIFRASGSIMTFKGFTVVYDVEESSSSARDEEGILPPLKKNQVLRLEKLEPAQHFTQPPPRFSEATLIKALEENGIGRPSTYATIISNINQRAYVRQEKGRFRPTELGFLVTDLLVQNFPQIMDIHFTAQMEQDLDKIERGQVKWIRVLKKFYDTFEKSLEKAKKEMKAELPAGLDCPVCGRPMVIKSGKNGLFLACSGYPECTHTSNFERDGKGRIVTEKEPEATEVEEICEKCGRPMVIKRGRFGPFLACSGYPECKNTKSLSGATGFDNGEPPPGQSICKVCGGKMVVKVSRKGQRFLACENYPKCTNTESLSTGVPCPQEGCTGTLVERSSKKGKRFYACDQYPKCRFLIWDEPYDQACPVCGTKVMVLKRDKEGNIKLSCRNKECDFAQPLENSSKG
ncbi:MAG TPA: type I DNA topoisomerase [Desulfobacteraceae bacterium]|nr:type I DNA topoisomerase [Desulfobacteraceae bacterium]